MDARAEKTFPEALSKYYDEQRVAAITRELQESMERVFDSAHLDQATLELMASYVRDWIQVHLQTFVLADWAITARASVEGGITFAFNYLPAFKN